MFKNLSLERPLAVLDLETTGTDPRTDRIVELSLLKVQPNGEHHLRTRRLNPGMPIPAEASAVHGITDALVAGEPNFRAIARDLLRHLEGCDLCGYNLKKFDLRVLYAEFQRAGLTLSLEGRAILDPMEIFHRREPRDLAAAVRRYLGREHEEGHTAAGDVRATAAVLDAMLDHYPDLPRKAGELHAHLADPRAADAAGVFRRIEGQLRFNVGQYRGQALEAVATNAPDYLEWMLRADFLEDAKNLIRAALPAARVQAPLRR